MLFVDNCCLKILDMGKKPYSENVHRICCPLTCKALCGNVNLLTCSCFFFVAVLGWGNILVSYAVWTLMIYLTDVWKLAFTQAAAIINVFTALIWSMPLFIRLLVDAYVGHYRMLLSSTLAICAGMSFLTMSTSPVLSMFPGMCSSYEPECIGNMQRMFFYNALALTGVGFAGHVVSLSGFVGEQVKENATLSSHQVAATYVIYVVAILVLPYIKPWLLHFGIPAIFYLVATLVFLSGFSMYTYAGPRGSYLTMAVRGFLASASRLFHQHPADPVELHEMDTSPALSTIEYVSLYACKSFDEGEYPNLPFEETRKKKWKMHTISDVEAYKLIVGLIPMTTYFVFLGLLSALEMTFFVEQAKNMSHKVGSLTIPLPLFWWIFCEAKEYFPRVYFKFSRPIHSMNLLENPVSGIMVSMILGILCCVTAAKVESHRLGAVKSRDSFPISVLWLVPQFFLLAAADGMSEVSTRFYNNAYSPDVSKYMFLIGCLRTGFGSLGSILVVHVLGRVQPSWFQDTINHSRLDMYYWFLACLCAINFVCFVLLRCCSAWRATREVKDSQESRC